MVIQNYFVFLDQYHIYKKNKIDNTICINPDFDMNLLEIE